MRKKSKQEQNRAVANTKRKKGKAEQDIIE